MSNYKYAELSDKNWLKEKYEHSLLSTTEIGKLIGSSKDAVRVALIRYQIPLRKSKETLAAQKKRNGRKTKYGLLNNKCWLSDKYLNEGLNTLQIQDLVGAKTTNSVRQALIGFNIPIRNQSEGGTHNREEDGFILNMDVINGCLLGDACLLKWSKHSEISLPRFKKKNKNYDHVLWVANLLFENNQLDRIKEEYSTLNGKKFQAFKLESLTHKELLSIYNKWYPKHSEYIKVVPPDIEINSSVLLHWFLDDGSTSWINKKHRKKFSRIRLTFCSESFTKEDQEMLCEKINNKFNLKAKVHPYNQGTGWRIRIPESKTNDFFEVIGSCPKEVPSMAYKWKIAN